MTYSSSQKIRKRLQQILFGTIFSGMVLIPGMGLVSNNLLAAPNENVIVQPTGTTNVTSLVDHYIGLTGPDDNPTVISTSGVITITEGIAGTNETLKGVVLGVLNEEVSTLDVDKTVSMTLSGDTAAIIIGTEGASEGLARLIVTGKSSKAGSSLTVEEGTVTINGRGILQIGSDTTTDGFGAVGSVHIKNDGQLINLGADATGRGILVYAGSSLTLGTSKDDLWKGDGTAANNIYNGDGRLVNSGTVTIYNGTGVNDTVTIGVYSDTPTGKLTANGNLGIMGGIGSEGTIIIAGSLSSANLDISSNLSVSGSLTTEKLTLWSGVESITNKGTIDIGDTITSSATTLAISNQTDGFLKVAELNLKTGWSLTNTTTNPTSTVTPDDGTIIDELTLSGGSVTNTQGIFDAEVLNLLSGTITLSGGTAYLGNSTTDKKVTQSGGEIKVNGSSAYAIIADYTLTGGSFTSSSGSTTIEVLTQTGGTGSVTGGTVTITKANFSADSEEGTSASFQTAGGTTSFGLLTLVDGEVETTSGTTTFVSLDQTGGMVSTTGGTAKITDGSVSQEGLMSISSGSLAITRLNVDSAMMSDFLSVTGTGNVAVSGILSMTNGTIGINASNEQTESFTLQAGATLELAFAKESEMQTLFNLEKGTINLVKGSYVAASNITELAAGAYKAKLVNLVDEDDATVTNESIFAYSGKAFFDFENATADNDYIMSLTIRDFTSFAQSDNEKSVANYIETLRAEGTAGDGLGELLNYIVVAAPSAEQVQEAMNQLTGVQRANTMMMAMDSPWNHAFNQLTQTFHRQRVAALGSRQASPENQYQQGYAPGSYYRGQMNDCNEGACPVEHCDYGTLDSVFHPVTATPNSIWASGYYTGHSGNNDGNSPKYYIARPGFVVGYDLLQNSDVIAGAMLSYSFPKLHSDYQMTNMDNFQVGLYAARRSFEGAIFKVFGDVGIQQYNTKRTMTIPLDDIYTSNYSGMSFAVAAQLSKEMQLNCHSIFRPLIQVDMQQVWQQGVTETGSDTYQAALEYQKSNWNRTFFRAGFETELNAEFLQITGRAIYACQLGGNHGPSMEAQFVDTTDPSQWMSISGVNLGGSFLDVGMGVLGYLDCQRNWSIAGNYDYTTSNNSNAHTGVISLSYLY